MLAMVRAKSWMLSIVSTVSLVMPPICKAVSPSLRVLSPVILEVSLVNRELSLTCNITSFAGNMFVTLVAYMAISSTLLSSMCIIARSNGHIIDL